MITQVNRPIPHTNTLRIYNSQFVGRSCCPPACVPEMQGVRAGPTPRKKAARWVSPTKTSRPRGSVWAVRRSAPVSFPTLKSGAQPHCPPAATAVSYTWVLVPASARHGLLSTAPPPPPALMMVLGSGHRVGWMDASPPAPERATAPDASNGVPDPTAACLWSERIARQMPRCDGLSTGCPPVPSCVLCAWARGT